MLDQITIITATRNRHNYLERIIDYYSTSGIQMLIADETEKRYAKPLPPNVSYNHYSGVPYLNRLDDIIKKVKTPYTVLCADDDFIIPDGISKCISFLENNKDYNSAQGQYVFFYHSKNKLFYSPAYLATAGCDIYETSARERIKRYNELLIQFYYCVHRTENLKSIFSSLKNDVTNLSLSEVFIGMCTLIDGKHKVLPGFYSARQSLYGSSGSLAGIDVCAAAEEYKNEYNSYLTVISTLISKKDNITFDEAFDFFKKSMTDFITYRYSKKPSLNKMVLLFIKKTISLKIRKNLRHCLLIVQESSNNKKNTQLALKINGYPFIAGSPEYKELKRVEQCVLKYNIQ